MLQRKNKCLFSGISSRSCDAAAAAADLPVQEGWRQRNADVLLRKQIKWMMWRREDAKRRKR
jgi:hypothetical protein